MGSQDRNGYAKQESYDQLCERLLFLELVTVLILVQKSLLTSGNNRENSVSLLYFHFSSV
jgi:hypothetical protein